MVIFSFSLREKVPKGRMRVRAERGVPGFERTLTPALSRRERELGAGRS
jgi:hypothetical protein